MKRIKRALALCLALTLALAAGAALPANLGAWTVAQAESIGLTRTKATMYVGDTLQLRVNRAGVRVKQWKSSNKAVASVDSKGKVTAKKAGKATITAVVGAKKYTCKVTVKSPIVIKYDKLPKTTRYLHDSGEVMAKYKVTKIAYTFEKDDFGKYKIDLQAAGKKTYDWMDGESWAEGESQASTPIIGIKLYKGSKVVASGYLIGPDEVYTGQSWGLKDSYSAFAFDSFDEYRFTPGTYTLKLVDANQWD